MGISFKERSKKRLGEWLRKRNDGLEIPPGIFNYHGQLVEHRHILPLGNSLKKGRQAIVDALLKYKVLTDGIEYEPACLPLSKLHYLAHHLTSSQILCYNFFRLFLPAEVCKSRQMPLTPELCDWVNSACPSLPKISPPGICQFEYLLDSKEGTSFDFMIRDEKTTVFFEMKYTESEFGGCKKDDRHKEKFKNVYIPLLYSQSTVKRDIGMEDFFKFYQLFRNAIRAGENTYFVAIFPAENEACVKEFITFKSLWVNPHNERVIGLAWEDAFTAHPLATNSELKAKYGL